MCITIKRKDYVMIIIKNNLSRIKIKYNKTVTVSNHNLKIQQIQPLKDTLKEVCL